jgi:uncharacterized protein (TIGR02217 family)
MAGQKVHSLGAHVAVRADPDPSGGGLAAPAYSDQTEDSDVIYTDIIFPECIAYGSTGVPRYMTDKVEVYSGAEQRNARWEFPKHEYAVKLENIPADEISEIMRIWHVCSGDHAAFLFMDPLDHTTNISDTVLAGDEVTPFDQVVGTAIGGQATYQLFKFYDKASRSKRRRIKYPKLDTLRVAVGGVEVFNFDYDYDTGLLTFNQAIGSQTATVAISGGVFTGFTVGSLQVGDLSTSPGLLSVGRTDRRAATPCVLRRSSGASRSKNTTAQPTLYRTMHHSR